MSLETAVYGYLTESPEVYAVLGDRIYPEIAPTDRLIDTPYLTYSQNNEAPAWHTQGPSRVTNTQLVFELCCGDRAEREQVSNILQVALEAFASQSRDQIWMMSGQVTDQSDTYILPLDGSERGVYQRSLVFALWYADL